MLIFTADGQTGAIQFHTSRNPTVRYNGNVYSCMSGDATLPDPTDGGFKTEYLNLADPDLGIHLVQNQAHIRDLVMRTAWIRIQFEPQANVNILGNQGVLSLYLYFQGPSPVNSSSELERVQNSTSRTTE